MSIIKPPVLTPWADSGSTSQPTSGQLASGYFGQAIPGFKQFNWLFNYAMNGIRYLCQMGIADWDAAESYPQYSVSRVGSIVYMLTGTATIGLAPGSDTGNWTKLLPSPGALLRTSLLTSGTSIASISGCSFATVEMWGGGGAGGGTPSEPTSPIQTAVAGGGASGGYAFMRTLVVPTNWSYVIGAGGAGSAGSAGGSGGNTTFSDGTTTATAFGGPGATAGTTISSNNGGQTIGASPPAVSTFAGGSPPATIAGSGQAGGSGLIGQPTAGGPFGISGSGGASFFGGNGVSQIYSTTGGNDGSDAIAPGSAGGGAIVIGNNSTVSPAHRGGNGFRGLIILREYA